MKKKHITEEEIALKKSEIARRRKHQSIQRAEQDKVSVYFGNRFAKKIFLNFLFFFFLLK